jgi:hypothetical protein
MQSSRTRGAEGVNGVLKFELEWNYIPQLPPISIAPPQLEDNLRAQQVCEKDKQTQTFLFS